jgi:hypothetical protein
MKIPQQSVVLNWCETLGLKTVVWVKNLKKNNEQRIIGPNEQEVIGE